MRDLEYNQFDEFNEQAPEIAPPPDEIQPPCGEFQKHDEQKIYAETGADEKRAKGTGEKKKPKQRPSIGRIALQFVAVSTAAVAVVTVGSAISNGAFLPRLGEFGRETAQKLAEQAPIKTAQAAISPQIAIAMWKGEMPTELTMEAPSQPKPTQPKTENSKPQTEAPTQPTTQAQTETPIVAPTEPTVVAPTQPIIETPNITKPTPKQAITTAPKPQKPKPEVKPKPQKPKPEIKPPVELIKPPVEPIKPQVEPIKPPVEPIKPPVEPIKPPVEPIKPPVEPIKPPVEPIKPPVEPEPDPHYCSFDLGKETKPATCTAEGTKTFTCAGCGTTKTEPIPMVAHAMEATVQAPTCTAKGYTSHKCKNCPYTKPNDAETPMVAHSYGAFTADADGINHSHICTVCSNKETVAHSPWANAGDTCEGCGAVKQLVKNLPVVSIGAITSDGATLSVNTARAWEAGTDTGTMAYRLDVLDGSNAVISTKTVSADITAFNATEVPTGVEYKLKLTPVYTIDGTPTDLTAVESAPFTPKFGEVRAIGGTDNNLLIEWDTSMNGIYMDNAVITVIEHKLGSAWEEKATTIKLTSAEVYRWKLTGKHLGVDYTIYSKEYIAP